jgi:hypothetical protein
MASAAELETSSEKAQSMIFLAADGSAESDAARPIGSPRNPGEPDWWSWVAMVAEASPACCSDRSVRRSRNLRQRP